MDSNKTLSRVESHIASEKYYEAHQAVRTIVARHVRQKKWTEAIQALYTSSLLLAEAGEYGSVCDLCSYLLSVYADGAIDCDGVSKGRLAQVVSSIPVTEPALRAIARQAESWMKVLNISGGDPDIHHLFGSIFAAAGDFLNAEYHLLLGTKDSAVTLAEMHGRWAKADKNDQLPFYYSRGVFGYLSICDMRNVNAYLATMASSLKTEKQGDIEVSEEYPLVNYLQMLVIACACRERALYHTLQEQYKPQQYPEWTAALTAIQKDYFGIEPPKEFNIMDLMGGFLK